ncbi:hypothetical protein [Streptomyces cacaoi]
MEMHSRLEPRGEYLGFELAVAARKLVEQVMLVKPGEHVVLTGDTSSDRRVVDATAQAVAAAGGHPVVVWYETLPGSSMEPPRPVAGAIADADVWIEFAVSYVMHSEAFRTAMANGCRYTNLTAMDVHMLVATVGRPDFAGVMRLGNALVRLLEQADEVRITSRNGTDITGRNGDRPINLRGKPAERPGETVMLSGQISWNPLEETQQGTLVFDGALWPPDQLGLLRSPVRCTIEDGVVTAIDGADSSGQEAEIFRSWMESFGDPNMFRVAHWSLGFNPGVPAPTGRIVEDERVFGCVELGIGTKGAWIGGEPWVAAAHTDGSILGPSIYLDGEAIEIDGRYVHPELVQICKELEVPGY